ncbi:MAG: leucine-rich repeat domain-containing protein [Coprobacillus sp.]|nr:leucine-rich repeat domain-containing protein [Coprobacillus sp.]
MPRNSEDLSADYYIDQNDQPPEEKKKLTKKQKNYIIGLSITAVIVVAVALVYYFAATVWLVDYTTLGYLTYAYEADSNEASVVRIDLESDYPENFRIPAKVKGKTITKIEDGAFRDATRLKSVTMTDNIVSIGSEAFQGCTDLETINFSSSINYIGTNAFENTYYFDNLPDDDLTLVDSILLKVGINYFEPDSILVNNKASYDALDEKYKAYTNVYYWEDMPEVTMWMNGLFANNENLVYVEMPDYFEEVPANSFQNCYNLLGIDFPDNVQSIGDYCFAGCTQLVDGNLPNTLTSIGDYAFQGTSTKIPTDLTHCTNIGVGAFQDCSGVTSIIYPANLSSISNYCFDGCYNLTDFQFEDSDTITLIGTACFRGTGFESFTVPEHVNVIRDYTFSNCENLTTLYLYNNTTNTGITEERSYTWEEEDPETGEMVEYEETYEVFTADGVDSINAYAFYNSPKFNTINLYDVNGNITQEPGVINLPVTLIRTTNSNGSVGGYSFVGTSVKAVKFNYGALNVGQYLFRNVTTLESVSFAANEEGEYSLTSIGISAFEGDYNLSQINFPNSLESIGTSAFKGCSSITSALLGHSNVTSIPIDCFNGCSSLQEVTIGRSVTRIYEGSFDGTVSLKEIVIPSNVSTIGSAGSPVFVNETDDEHTDKLNIFMEYTQSQYESARNFASGWFDPTCCNAYHYSEEAPDADAKPAENFSGYWHYVDGEPVIWNS